MKAIIHVLWDTWIRAAEVCSLEKERVDLKGRPLIALTKGNIWETKIFSSETADILKEWIKLRNRLARRDCPTLCCNTRTGKPLTRDGLRSNFNRLSNRAGFKVSPHDFRRGGASYAAENGMPDRLGMLQGGWKDHK